MCLCRECNIGFFLIQEKEVEIFHGRIFKARIKVAVCNNCNFEIPESPKIKKGEKQC